MLSDGLHYTPSREIAYGYHYIRKPNDNKTCIRNAQRERFDF